LNQNAEEIGRHKHCGGF